MRISDWNSDVCSSDLQPAVTKTHFVFGRVHIDIDPALIDLQTQHETRMTAVVQHIGIGMAHRVRHQALAHGASSEERRGGKEGVSTCSYRCWMSQLKKKPADI